MRLFSKKGLMALSILLVLLATVAAAIAQNTRYPTYEYYGKVLSADEFLKLVEQETPLHCVQIPSSEAYLSDRAPVDFICFHTLDEADWYGNEAARVP